MLLFNPFFQYEHKYLIKHAYLKSNTQVHVA